jgi:hypothetical protein
MQAEPDPTLILEREVPEEEEVPTRVVHPDGFVTEEGEFHE